MIHAKLRSIQKVTSDEGSVMVQKTDTSSSGCHGAACGRSLKGANGYNYHYKGSKGSKSKGVGAYGYYYSKSKGSKSKGAKSANYVSALNIPFHRSRKRYRVMMLSISLIYQHLTMTEIYSVLLMPPLYSRQASAQAVTVVVWLTWQVMQRAHACQELKWNLKLPIKRP
jgi:hypothetical protein